MDPSTHALTDIQVHECVRDNPHPSLGGTRYTLAAHHLSWACAILLSVLPLRWCHEHAAVARLVLDRSWCAVRIVDVSPSEGVLMEYWEQGDLSTRLAAARRSFLPISHILSYVVSCFLQRKCYAACLYLCKSCLTVLEML